MPLAVAKPSERLLVNKAKVADEAFDDEVIVINLESGAYYSLPGTAAEVWRGLAEGPTRRDLMAALVARFEAEPGAVVAAVGAFLDDLVREGLVEVQPDQDGPGPAPLDVPRGTAPFQPPTLSAHTNMADLLLLDPIHDVDDQGWPHLPPE